jgi:uncharacterized Ntn-hydrolase superfamily protein
MTFSVTARCPNTEDLGIAISTAVPAVGNRCIYVKVDVGAIATQSFTNIMLGINGIKLLELGLSPDNAITSLLEEDENKEQRQVGAINSLGRAFAWTGTKCIDWAGHLVGSDHVVAGNMLISKDTIIAMSESIQSTSGELSNRLLTALEAGQNAGGDKRGRVSAALLVASKQAKRYHNLRVDAHSDPVNELRRIYNLTKKRYN